MNENKYFSGLFFYTLVSIFLVLVSCSSPPPAENEQVQADTASGDLVSIRVDSFEVESGGAISVPVEISSSPDNPIAAITLAIGYDQSVIQATDCTVDSGLTGVCNIDLSGEVRFSGINPAGFDDDFVPVTIMFEAIGASGTASEILVEPSGIANASGVMISNFQIESGQISIQ